MPRTKHQMDPDAVEKIDFSALGHGAKGPWLRESLTSLILSMNPGEGFPSDRVLADRYKVARMTATREVNDLAAKGLLERIPGKGTYVRRPSGSFETLTSFTDMATWYRATARILSVEVVAATGHQREALDLAPAEKVVSIRRLRLIDGEPLAFEETFLAESRFGAITREEIQGRSLYTVLSETYESHASSADQTITVHQAGIVDSDLLEVEEGTAVMRIDRVTRDPFGLAIDTSTAICHPDRFRVRIQVGLT